MTDSKGMPKAGTSLGMLRDAAHMVLCYICDGEAVL